MSLLARLRQALAIPALASGDLRYASPYSGDHLFKFLPPEWWPSQGISREQALTVPAVARARKTICTSIARMELAAYRGDTKLNPQPLWISRTDGPWSPWHRMAMTVDDLLFYDWSAWAVARGSDNQVIAADRIPFEQWRTDDDGRVLYLDPVTRAESVVDSRSVVLIPGTGDGGLLVAGAAAIRHAADLLTAASKAAENPAAYLELHQTNNIPIDDKVRDKVMAGWRAARRGENGGVAFTSAGLELREHGSFSEHLLVEGRNAAALDIARQVGIPGLILDAATENSMTYVNAQAKAQDLVEYGLTAYMTPISARLGMDDVVPRGVRVAFDLEAFIGPGSSEGAPDDDGGPTPPTPPAKEEVAPNA